jgi:hypothetical protein
MMLAEDDAIREDRHSNIVFSCLQQFTFQAAGFFILSDSLALFRAVLAGVIGGKTLGIFF